MRRTVEQAACRTRAFAGDVPQASFVLTQVVTCETPRRCVAAAHHPERQL